MKNEDIKAKGHHNVRGTHRNTFEFTKETHLTPRGDCIVAVAADKSMADLSEEFKKRLKTKYAKLQITISCGGLSETITAYGHPDLILTHPTDFVVRKTDYICPRTLAIRADKAAKDLDRSLVDNLKKDASVKVTLALVK
jgi:uncharacterized protein